MSLKRKTLILTYAVGFLLWSANCVHAQEATIQLGPDEIGDNQAWTITLTVKNGQIKDYQNFPDIPGFRKGRPSSQQSMTYINGQSSSSHSIVMNYMPTKQGTFTLPAFTMSVNSKSISSPGKSIKVGPPVQQNRNRFRSIFDQDPTDDFFGAREETEFVDVKEDAFLGLTTNKDEVYVGEGVNMKLAFYVAENNRAPLNFYKIGDQLNEIQKKLLPKNCWEESFLAEQIEAESVIIGNKRYIQYRLYEGTFYPLNNDPIVFPSVTLEMLKYKVAKNPSFFGSNRQEGFKKFYSKPKTVKVKDLPPHPLKDIVAVGDYYLDEKIKSKVLETGNSASYGFNIYGEGNISAIQKPEIPNDGNFEFYEPNIQQNISRKNGRVTGTKSFNYFMIPREPGEYNLGKYFNWIFFNTKKKQYDTLRAMTAISVSGESKKNEAIQSTDTGVFYDKVLSADNKLMPIHSNSWQPVFFNVFVVLMLGCSVYLIFKKQ